MKQVQILSDHALVLYNKTQAKIRSLQSLHQSRRHLCHKIAQVQSCIQTAATLQQKQTPLTAYEISLLRDRQKLQDHQESLEAAAAVIAECKKAMHDAHIFHCWVTTLQESWQSPAGQDQKVHIQSKHKLCTAMLLLTQHLFLSNKFWDTLTYMDMLLACNLLTATFCHFPICHSPSCRDVRQDCNE